MNPFFSQTAILSIIFGVAVATYALRFGGLLLSERMPKSSAFLISAHQLRLSQ